MTFTRRGRALVGVVLFSVAMAVLYGPRSLNAVVVPGLVALAVSALYVRRIDQPELDRLPPEDGFVGEHREVRLDLRTDSSFTGRLVDRIGTGLSATDNDRTTTIETGTLTYEVTFDRRGAHTLGPARITVRDVLGLAERTYTYHNEHEVLVYPRVRDLTGSGRHELNLLPESQRSAMRNEFEDLREYQRGDALRDIHWKSSAKRPDEELMVKEYTAQDDQGTVALTAEAEGGRPAADAMAEAAASVATFLLSAGLTVEMSIPETVIETGQGRAQRHRILEALARTGPGHVPEGERSEADVTISAGRDGSVTIRVDDRELSYDQLFGGRWEEDPVTPEEVVGPDDPSTAGDSPIQGRAAHDRETDRRATATEQSRRDR